MQEYSEVCRGIQEYTRGSTVYRVVKDIRGYTGAIKSIQG